MKIEDFVRQEVTKLPEHRGLRIEGDIAWLRCPDPKHKGGFENSPSAKINLTFVETEKGKIAPGSLYCFGCGCRWSWSELATRFNLKNIQSHKMYSDSPKSKLLSEEDRAKVTGDYSELIPKDAIAWPAYQNWRTISGEVVNKVGGLIYFDYGIKLTRALFPVKVRGETVGFIKANLKPQKKGLNYINSAGKWSKQKGLFPYDYVKRTLKTKDPRIVYLVEGPRDALALIQNDLAGIAILGTTWSKQKRDLILALEPNLVVLMLDSDDAGLKGAKEIKSSLKGYVRLRHFIFPPKPDGTKRDASDLTAKQAEKINSKYLQLLRG